MPSLPAGSAAPGHEPRAARGPGRSASAWGSGRAAAVASCSSCPGATTSWPARTTGPWPGCRAPKEPGGRQGGADVRSFRAEIARAFPWAGIEGRRVTLVHRGSVPGEGGPDGLWTRPRLVDHGATGGPAGLITPPGSEVHDRAGRVRARSGPGLFLPGAAPVEEERRAARPPRPSPGRARFPGRSPSGRARPCVTRWRARSRTRSCAASTWAPPGRRRQLETDEVARVMAEELGWDEGRTAGREAGPRPVLRGRLQWDRRLDR